MLQKIFKNSIASNQKYILIIKIFDFINPY